MIAIRRRDDGALLAEVAGDALGGADPAGGKLACAQLGD